MKRNCLRKVLSILIVVLITFGSINLKTTAYAQTARPMQKVIESDLDKVKQTLSQANEAINLKDINKLSSHFTKEFTLINLENKKIAPLQSFLDYFDALFNGDKATVKNLVINIQIDPEPIYLDKKIAIIQGSANEAFTYYKGKNQILHTRWTAVLEKNSLNKHEWQISAMHHSSGITKSMINDVQSQILKTALGGLVVGLVLGMLFISLPRKNKR